LSDELPSGQSRGFASPDLSGFAPTKQSYEIVTVS
jgi:hypothetical protein